MGGPKMRQLAVALVGLAMLSMTVPANASGDALREENRAFMLSHLDDWDPDRVVDVRVDGEWTTMTASEALDLALDMVEGIDLEQIAASAEASSHGTGDWAGDILELALGGADCGESTSVGPETPGAEPDPQLELQEGDLTYVEGVTAGFHNVFSYTMKEGDNSLDETPVHHVGKGLSLCISNFVYLSLYTGFATTRDEAVLPLP